MASTTAEETAPLLAGASTAHSERSITRRKPWYRPRPLWLVPFAVSSALVRGMTLAPRVQVYTQLACAAVYDQYNHTHYTIPHTLPGAVSSGGHTGHTIKWDHSPHDWDRVMLTGSSSLGARAVTQAAQDHAQDPCLADPAVQARAARIQTLAMTTMGLLSALTTGWWGHFGERHGRTKVLAASAASALIGDLTYTLISAPRSPFGNPVLGQILLVAAPFFEGLLGGWSTAQATTSAYVSDCTSDGSRASIFSRFVGTFFLGVAIGPALGGWLIRHPILDGLFPAPAVQSLKSVTTVFVVAVLLSSFNIVFALLIMPESRGYKESKHSVAEPPVTPPITTLRSPAIAGTLEQSAEAVAPAIKAPGHFTRILLAFSVFLPRNSYSLSGKRRRDWSMTLVAATLVSYLLSTGIFQIKYLYAEHTFNWGAEELSYYITCAAGLRMIHTLIVMPFLISRFKPKPGKSTSSTSTTGSRAIQTTANSDLVQEMAFDLRLARFSLVIDILSHVLVALSPANSSRHAQALFVCFSVISGFGSGLVPAIQSLALCVMQARSLQEEDNTGGTINGSSGATKPVSKADGGVGALFGALAALQAIGQQIIGPIIFGALYATTVGTFSKAVFIAAASILVFALVFICILRPDSVAVKTRRRRRVDDPEEETGRGRSRTRKDLRVTTPPIIAGPASTTDTESGTPA